MGALRIAGKVVGATDGPSIDLPACYRGRLRKQLGCDEAQPDDAMLAKVDSMFAQKVIAALSSKLEPDELGRCLSILRDADLISNEEERAVNEAMQPDEPEPDDENVAMASDAIAASFFARYPGAARIGYQGGGMAADAAYQARKAPQSAAQRRLAADARSKASTSFDARYPDAKHIKIL